MEVTVYDITARERLFNLGFASISDFSLSQSCFIPADEILRNPDISLYTLDFKGRCAVFVETPPKANLSTAPFYYMTQYESAIKVMVLPFSDFIQLSMAMSLREERVTFIYSVGRAASTLASQIFAEIDGVESISEPDALTVLVAARSSPLESEQELKALLAASVQFLCKSENSTNWVIKGRSQMIEVGDWLHQLYSRTKNVFMYRDAETWLVSAKRAFLDAEPKPPEEQIKADRVLRAYLSPVTHLIANYPEDQHLTKVGLAVLSWLSAMDACMKMIGMGAEMLPIKFSSWQSQPEETALAMLDYCNCQLSDLSGIRGVLKRDSQDNTVLSQENVKKRDYDLQISDLVEMRRHLQNHDTNQSADFEIPGTLSFM